METNQHKRIEGSPAQYLPDELAPPIDEHSALRLRALAQRQLPERSAQVLLRLVTTFRCWEAAYEQVRRNLASEDPTFRGQRANES